MLVPVLENLGVRVVVQPVSFAQMLAQYYRHDRGTRTSNLFFLGTNFREPFDPFYTYHTDKAWQGSFNTSGLRDSALMEAALAMRQAEAGDPAELSGTVAGLPNRMAQSVAHRAHL